jgi:class 3 adenylate cyclase
MDIVVWLRSLGLGKYEAAFRDNEIDETVLPSLTHETLKELGVTAVGHRLKLLDAIAALRNEASGKAPSLDTATTSSASSAHPEDRAERRQVTVMFADLVGSTALSARMDPEDLREVISAYQKCVAGIVRRFGGFVSQYLGDGVLAYFGYPQAHEDDAERAVRASVEFVAAVAELKTSAPLQTRVGIATGLVVVGDVLDAGGPQERGIIGETPNLAARLQGVAAPNMVVIAESTRKLLGNLFELQDLGTREVKGIGAPVRVWAVLRAIVVASRFEALHAGSLSIFVGREHELEVLERGLDKARSELIVIDLSAEPGMGKSRLLYEFRQRIGKERAFVLSGSCSPDGQQTPFLPLIEVVRGSFRVSAGEAEKEVAQKLEMGLTALGLHSPRNLGLLLHLLGLKVPDDALAGLDGVLIGLRTRELLQQLLEARCRLSPVVMMMIEDLHWVDSASEELLGKIVENQAMLRLLLLLTRRPEYVPPWLDHSAITKVLLQPLPIGDIRRLIRARLGVESLPEPLAWQVAEKAEGNPLFAEEFVSLLSERGIVRTTTTGELDFEATVVVATALPASVHSLLAARVDRLIPTDRALLQAASVIGRRFDAKLLADVVDETVVAARLESMHELDLIRPANKSNDYVFKHALIRDALYQSLLTGARKSLHLKIAQEIERRSGNRLNEVAEVLAHHYSQSDRSDKAFAFLSMAGSKSLSVYSLDDAAIHLNAGLALLDKNPDCATDVQVAEFLVFYTLHLVLTGRVKILIDVLERYLARIERLGDNPSMVIIRHRFARALIFNARYRDAAALQQGTSRMADRLGDSRSKAYSLIGDIWVSTICAPKTLVEFEALKREAIKAASDTTDAYLHSVARWVIFFEELHRGRMTKAREVARELMQVGRMLNDPRSTGQGLWWLGWIGLTADSYAETLSYSEQALEVAVTANDRINASLIKSCALVLLRRTAEGAAQLEENRIHAIAQGWLHPVTSSDGVLGVCRVLQGNIALGIHFIEEAILQREKEGYRDLADWCRLVLAEVYLQIIAGHERPPLLTLVKNLPILLKVTVTGPSRIRALIAHILENPHFDPAGHHVGRAQMLLGQLYKAKKRRVLAIQHLTEAQRILSQFGNTPILARVETALAELGA